MFVLTAGRVANAATDANLPWSASDVAVRHVCPQHSHHLDVCSEAGLALAQVRHCCVSPELLGYLQLWPTCERATASSAAYDLLVLGRHNRAGQPAGARSHNPSWLLLQLFDTLAVADSDVQRILRARQGSSRLAFELQR